MALNKRSHAILQRLMRRKHFVPIEELINEFKVSRRTIYHEMDRINYWLKKHQIKPIKHERSRGFYLTEIPTDFVYVDSITYEYTADERVAWITLHLLISEKRLILKSFGDWLDVSRNTIINDVNKVRNFMDKYDLSLIFNRELGYTLEGREEDKRRVRTYYLSYLLHGQTNKAVFLQQVSSLIDLSSIDLKKIYSVLSLCEEELQVHYADEYLYFMSIQIFLNLRRIDGDHFIQMDKVEKEVIVHTNEFVVANKSAMKLEQIYEVNIPEDEVFFLTTYLLSAKLQHEYSTMKFSSTQYSLKRVITNMINDFQRYAGIIFKDRQELENSLLVHLQPAYYRSIYGLNLQNPLTQVIREKYKDIYSITKRVVHHFEDLTGHLLQDNEIAFITIHFGGWLRREEQISIARKKALIICNSGIGTSAILRKQLEQLFPMVDFYPTISVREYEQKTDWSNISFAISTVDAMKKNHPLFVIQPILTEFVKDELIQKINYIIGGNRQTFNHLSVNQIINIIKDYAKLEDEQGLMKELQSYLKADYSPIELLKPRLTELLEDNIQIIQEAKDWEDAIRIASEPLLRNNKISSNYIDAMIRVIKEKGPYVIIAPGIALPHATPDEGVLELGMSLLILQKPTFFSEKPEHKVNIIIILATTDQESHLRAMSNLNTLLSKEENIKMIKDSETIEQAWTFLVENS